MTRRYPKGLYFLFLTEMWERFSFYGISAILILYLTKGLGMSDLDAGLISGAYMAFTFMTPVLGGFVSDRVLGLRYSVTIGGILILLGNLVLALNLGLTYVFVGLVLVALGTGYLKSTVSVMVGKLYDKGDTHRDAGYTLFYMGINVGALLAGIVIAWVGENYGWTKGFYLSSAGMLIGLILFQAGYPFYRNDEDGFRRDRLLASSLHVSNLVWIVFGTVALGGLMLFLFQHSDATKVAMTIASFAIIAGLLVMGWVSKEKSERNSVFAILIIIVAAICFQSYFKQLYNSLTLFVDRDVNTTVRVTSTQSFKIPAASVGTVTNSALVILFAGVFTWMWGRLADRGRNPSIPTKMVIALCLAVASAGVLALLARHISGTGQKGAIGWVVLAIAILTFGELNILPMGLSAISALAPKRFASLLMGSWFLCNSLGGYFSGLLTGAMKLKKDRLVDVVYTASTYCRLYWMCALALVGVAVVMALITPFMKRLMSQTSQA